jgi:hypothetical protein
MRRLALAETGASMARLTARQRRNKICWKDSKLRGIRESPSKPHERKTAKRVGFRDMWWPRFGCGREISNYFELGDRGARSADRWRAISRSPCRPRQGVRAKRPASRGPAIAPAFPSGSAKCPQGHHEPLRITPRSRPSAARQPSIARRTRFSNSRSSASRGLGAARSSPSEILLQCVKKS